MGSREWPADFGITLVGAAVAVVLVTFAPIALVLIVAGFLGYFIGDECAER